ncbi:MAG: DNA gyrase C-terminal beta-propeller domain-containing protein, partial [Actinomycetes bacterium]
RTKLMKRFTLSEIQAEYILELKLRRLTKFSKLELENESKSLEKEIADLRKILYSEKNLKEVATRELQEVSDNYGDDRRTTITDGNIELKPVSAAKASAIDAQLADSPCHVTLTSSGQVLRTSELTAKGTKRKKHDAVRNLVTTTTRTDIGFLSSDGVMHRVHASDIPGIEGGFDPSSSVSVSEFLGLAKSIKVIGAFELNDSTTIAVGTQQGNVKRISGDWAPKSAFEIISLKPGDTLVGAELSSDKDDLIFVTDDAQLLRFSADTVRPQGRGAAGMAGVKLSDDAKAIFFTSIKATKLTEVLTAANNSESLGAVDAGSAKISLLSEFPAKGRATGGVRAQKFIRDENQLYFAYVGNNPLLAATSSGKPLELGAVLSKRDGSGYPLSSTIISVGTA